MRVSYNVFWYLPSLISPISSLSILRYFLFLFLFPHQIQSVLPASLGLVSALVCSQPNSTLTLSLLKAIERVQPPPLPARGRIHDHLPHTMLGLFVGWSLHRSCACCHNYSGFICITSLVSEKNISLISFPTFGSYNLYVPSFAPIPDPSGDGNMSHLGLNNLCSLILSISTTWRSLC